MDNHLLRIADSVFTMVFENPINIPMNSAIFKRLVAQFTNQYTCDQCDRVSDQPISRIHRLTAREDLQNYCVTCACFQNLETGLFTEPGTLVGKMATKKRMGRPRKTPPVTDGICEVSEPK